MSDKQILITRYPNRRLYNTSSSEYINLSGVSSLVKEGKNIKITDKETGEDLTKQYLLQIISDVENKDGNILSEKTLVEIIKSYSNVSQKIMPDMIEKAFEFYQHQHNDFLKHFNDQKLNPFLNEKNSETLKDWQSKQTELMKNLFNPWYNNRSNEKFSEDETALNEKEEIEILKKQMSEIREELGKKNNI